MVKKQKKEVAAKLTKKASQSLEHATQKNITQIVEIENAQRQVRTTAERLSEAIARFCGSMTFVWVHIFWFSSWIGINSIRALAFDPFPYTFLTLVVSLEAIFLSTFILISQNHDTRMSERRNHLDLQINLLAEQESTKTLALLRKVAEKVGVKPDDPEMEVLTEEMEPAKLAEQIIAATDDAIEEAHAEVPAPEAT